MDWIRYKQCRGIVYEKSYFEVGMCVGSGGVIFSIRHPPQVKRDPTSFSLSLSHPSVSVSEAWSSRLGARRSSTYSPSSIIITHLSLTHTSSTCSPSLIHRLHETPVVRSFNHHRR